MTEPLFQRGAVVFDIHSTDKEAAIKEIVSRAKVFAAISCKERFIDAIFEREAEKCTGVGHGAAVANGKLPEFTKAKIALGISRRGIDYGSFDGKPVHLLFIVASESLIQEDYIKMMGALARIVRDEDFHKELLSSADEEEAEEKVIQYYSP